MATWFTSDTHFGHIRIIPYCKRPFTSVQAMNRELVERWNARVAPEDVVYHLGDFAMGPSQAWPDFGRPLNGYKILIAGNHDGSPQFMKRVGFEEVHTNIVREIDGRRVWMNHYPVNPYDHRVHLTRPPAPEAYDLAVCGHVHNTWLTCDGVVNVGVDVWEYAPVSLDRIVAVNGG